ncbi:response regulator transcription factor [Herbivorax sp. ANBcel31]|uniref:response regulator transcription factor n=1 Tax=Herbivorax sp. ANBcel31 TaxID=3069754 RepID=UPI0027B23689|nr:response regulator transcription factor [Herbivorax sp. ANBcel31]MDQ2087533.1 response regulator transcription factor [Herbivorax sp. ANBcel31]
MAIKVLVLEDDESIRSMLVVNFKKYDFLLYECATGEQALSVAQAHSDIDIAVLDIMLPGIDGIEVCKTLRDKYPFIGIIMLTAKAQERDKVYALESGADDYVTKPFGISEFMARVNSLLRRVKINTEIDIKKIRQGSFEIDDFARKFYKKGEEIELTPTEFSIIKLFMENPQKAIDRDEILTKVWGEYYFGELKIVDVNVRRLRKKIEDDPSNPKYIETVWGVGYRWKEEETS